MNISEIKELIQALIDSGVAKLEVQRGENRVRIVRGGSVQELVVAAPAAAAAVPAQPMVSAPVVPAAPAAPKAEEGLQTVKSPIVGTYYAAPSPGASDFVNVGDAVKPGKVLCIVESMKLMNEIECEVSGTIIAKHVDNGQPVEYGTALFTVRPS
ncbi:MAG: acetyl-CoA carboxylase, biotin carboxyl carrier protein [Acidobacteriia bacterium 12-62-4]|nr:MAG: acetyl-CoA carboxylase, biotin carboxyl carrier protein [Acidobacteriia bacterium 12-62-4]